MRKLWLTNTIVVLIIAVCSWFYHDPVHIDKVGWLAIATSLLSIANIMGLFAGDDLL